jgi:NADP-dependent 3-hydroxy acid dehydrogenase YdfG
MIDAIFEKECSLDYGSFAGYRARSGTSARPLGISVITAARSHAKAEKIANHRSEGLSAMPLKLDVTREEDWQAAYASAK